MQVYVLFLVWLGCWLIVPSNTLAQSGATPPPETKYWAGIITERPANHTEDAIYLVPRTEVIDGVATIRYEKHTTRPLRIRRVMVDSPASRAGLLPGDSILAFNNAPVTVHGDLVAAIQANADQTATVLILRDHQEFSVEIQPMVRPIDYVDRVRKDRATENALLTSGDSHVGGPTTTSDVVTLPGTLPGLLALAARNKSTTPESNPIESNEPERLEPSADVNFNRSTKLMIEKLEQFSHEWQELFERQKQTLKDLNERL